MTRKQHKQRKQREQKPPGLDYMTATEATAVFKAAFLAEHPELSDFEDSSGYSSGTGAQRAAKARCIEVPAHGASQQEIVAIPPRQHVMDVDSSELQALREQLSAVREDLTQCQHRVQVLEQQNASLTQQLADVKQQLKQRATTAAQQRTVQPAPAATAVSDASVASTVSHAASHAAPHATPVAAPVPTGQPAPSAVSPKQQPSHGPRRASFAEVLGAKQSERPQQQHAQQQGASQRPAAAPRPRSSVSFVSSLPMRTKFELAGPPASLLTPGGDQPGRVEAFLRERMPAASIHVVDAIRIGGASEPRIYFEVASLAQADALVQHRHAFKGSGITVYEVLTSDEAREHARLWPAFLKARAEGRRAQFRRAVLLVDGVRVRPAAA